MHQPSCSSGFSSRTSTVSKAEKVLATGIKFGQKYTLKSSSCRLNTAYNKKKGLGKKKAGCKLKPRIPNISATQSGLNGLYSMSAREGACRFANSH